MYENENEKIKKKKIGQIQDSCLPVSLIVKYIHVRILRMLNNILLFVFVLFTKYNFAVHNGFYIISKVNYVVMKVTPKRRNNYFKLNDLINLGWCGRNKVLNSLKHFYLFYILLF